MSEAMLLPGFRTHVANIAGAELRYYVGGAGPPLLLIHGLGGAATNWTGLAPLLARRRRVLVPDLPGHGRSDQAAAPEGLGSVAEAIAALAELEGVLPAPIVGHSMGADVAVHLALRRPRDVSALVAIASGGISSSTRRAKLGLTLIGLLRPSRVAARHRLLVAPRPRLRQLAFGWWGAADPAALRPDVALGFLEGPAHSRDTRTAGKALLSWNPDRDLAQVSCPRLVLWGARDWLTPIADGFRYARRLDAPLRTMAGSGHLLIGERPVECAALIDEFLDGLPAPGLHGVRKVDELPSDAELTGEPRRQRLDA